MESEIHDSYLSVTQTQVNLESWEQLLSVAQMDSLLSQHILTSGLWVLWQFRRTDQ